MVAVRALKELNKGNQYRDNSEADKAIKHCKNAWTQAVKVMKAKMKKRRGSGGDDDGS